MYLHWPGHLETPGDDDSGSHTNRDFSDTCHRESSVSPADALTALKTPTRTRTSLSEQLIADTTDLEISHSNAGSKRRFTPLISVTAPVMSATGAGQRARSSMAVKHYTDRGGDRDRGRGRRAGRRDYKQCEEEEAASDRGEMSRPRDKGVGRLASTRPRRSGRPAASVRRARPPFASRT